MPNILSKLNFILIAALFILYSIPSTGLGSLTIDPASQDPGPQRKVKVVASFYPILEFVKKVGGDRVEVSSLIPQGLEPHDFDPTVQQVQNAESADMLVYNGGGLEGPWIKKINAKFAVDSSQGSQGLVLPRINGAELTADDPHIWLDPILAKEQVKKICEGLIKVDPRNSIL